MNQILTCERCLQTFEFPQGSLAFKNTPWRYRVAGPFAVPDYANGAYSTVLTLRCLAHGLSLGRHPITYSTNLNLKIKGGDVEIDFACWYARERIGALGDEPRFVVGETKSFASEAIKQADIERLKRVASMLPGTVLLLAVMKNEFSESEKKRIRKLALWGRKPMLGGGPRAPVVVLTGTELFADHNVALTWEKAGGKRKELTEPASVSMDKLTTLADLTQQVYLDLPDYWSWYDDYARKRHAGRTKQ